MEVDPVQDWLEDLERRLELGPVSELWPMLAYVAGRELQIEDTELNAALRRAVLLLAAGGDPRREPELEGRAVGELADELGTTDRRRELMLGVDELVGRTGALPRVHGRLLDLALRPDLAWRAYACSLLAEEIGADD